MPITLSVPEMTCEGCENIVETAAGEVRGVDSATADRHEKTLQVTGSPDVTDLLQAMEFAGYDAELLENGPDPSDEVPDEAGTPESAEGEVAEEDDVEAEEESTADGSGDETAEPETPDDQTPETEGPDEDSSAAAAEESGSQDEDGAEVPEEEEVPVEGEEPEEDEA